MTPTTHHQTILWRSPSGHIISTVWTELERRQNLLMERPNEAESDSSKQTIHSGATTVDP